MAASRKDLFTIQALQITDAFLVLAAFWLASLLRESILSIVLGGGVDEESLWKMSWVLYIAVPFTPLVLERFGFYKRIGGKSAGASAWQLIQGVFIIGLFISLFAVFAKIGETYRLTLGFGGVLMFLLLFIRERVVRSWISSHRKRGVGGERVIIVGSTMEIDELLADLDVDVVSQWHIVDRFDLSFKTADDLFKLLKQESVGRVIFAMKTTPFEKVAQAVEVCELQGVEAWIAASFIRSLIARPVFDSVGAKPMLVLRSTPELSWELMAKKIIDRIGSFFLIVFTLPLWAIAVIGIKIASPGAPALFSQMRAGRYGKPFRIWKFRTMIPDAEQQLDSVKKSVGNQMDGPVFKLDGDPRIFAFGSLLRKLSIDELPQLFNVLKGEMSLVGPRPLPLYEIDAITNVSHRRRLSIKPGITCTWQAGGRNKITSFDEWVKLDLEYIDNWSLLKDIEILLKTVPAVLFSKGAK